MQYPDFYNSIPTIKVQDPLSDILGSFQYGEYEFSYVDIVKASGHSCPTVAGAFIVTMVALNSLYNGERAVRGELAVEFKDALEDGVTGVISNVISQITGATQKSGFKGLNKKFARHSLMKFDAILEYSIKFTRLDTGKSVEIQYNPKPIEQNILMPSLMQKVMQNSATDEELELFGKLWQTRVAQIFENIDKVILIKEV